MSRQDGSPFPVSESRRIENKVILLYLIDKVDIPVSNSQITDFIQSQGLMDFFSVQNYLKELENAGYIEKSSEKNSTFYTITDDGTVALESFSKQVPQSVRNAVTQFIAESRRQDFKTVAVVYYESELNGYIVKCSAYEDDLLLMELNVFFVTKEQAETLRNYWNGNGSRIYGNVMGLLINGGAENERDTKPERETDGA